MTVEQGGPQLIVMCGGVIFGGAGGQKKQGFELFGSSGPSGSLMMDASLVVCRLPEGSVKVTGGQSVLVLGSALGGSDARVVKCCCKRRV